MAPCIARPSSMTLFAGLVALAGWGFTRLPTGFLPTEDQGYFFAVGPAARRRLARAHRARWRAMTEAFLATPGIRDAVTITGYSLLDASSLSNAATAFVVMDPWEERTDASLSQEAILADLRAASRRSRRPWPSPSFPPPSTASA